MPPATPSPPTVAPEKHKRALVSISSINNTRHAIDKRGRRGRRGKHPQLAKDARRLINNYVAEIIGQLTRATVAVVNNDNENARNLTRKALDHVMSLPPASSAVYE